MSLLSGGLNSVEQGECRWRVTINNNLSNIYVISEVDAVVSGKSDTVHVHADYFPLAPLLVAADVSPVLGSLTSDVAFSATFGPCLVDRISKELFKLSIDSGAVIITGTGEFAGVNPNEIDVNENNIVAIYEETINGEIV